MATVKGEQADDQPANVSNLVASGDIKAATFHVGNDAGVDATIVIPAVATITIKKGLITGVI
jgi:hypothetical protein